MKTVIEMAREAGLHIPYWGEEEDPKKDPPRWTMTSPLPPLLKAFEALVRADEGEKYKWDIHSCGPTCKRYACVATREAVAAEREACARIAEEPSATTYECTVACGGPAQTFTQRLPKDAHEIAKQIRARGDT